MLVVKETSERLVLHHLNSDALKVLQRDITARSDHANASSGCFDFPGNECGKCNGAAGFENDLEVRKGGAHAFRDLGVVD